MFEKCIYIFIGYWKNFSVSLRKMEKEIAVFLTRYN
jgi:hypothetical protein